MRRRASAAVVGGLALVVMPLGGMTASAEQGSERLHPSTRANVMKAMEGEALAHATYRAYAVQAGKEHLPQVRDLYERTATEELREHFTEQAELTGAVGDNAANLRDAISGETYEAVTMYRKFAAEAKADGDTEAAELFAEISRDEADHRDRFKEALAAIKDPRSGARIRTDVSVEPTIIPAGPPRVSSERTLRNLRTAMSGEALAYAKYTLYADRARATGNRKLATLFHRTAQVELTEHFAEEGTLAGLVRGTRTNLCASIREETHEAYRMYPGFAAQAEKAGDRQAARLLAETGRDEARHASAFTAALSRLKGRCSAKH
jgi:rubrerythrin